LLKKHFCPECKAPLKKITVSRVINSKSSEAADFDFSAGDGWINGNVKFVWKEFECPVCKRHITINQMKEIENKQ